MFTTDGYLVKFEPGSGYIRRRLYDGVPGHVWYESEDCTGQPYLDYNDGLSDWLFPRGGEIFQLDKDVTSPVFAKVEWAAPFHAATYRSSIEPHQGECGPENANRTLVPISFVAPGDYGIKMLNLGAYGFRPPITAKPESADGIFCSGFESCPTNPAE